MHTFFFSLCKLQLKNVFQMSSLWFTEDFCILGPAVSRITGTNILLEFFPFTNTHNFNIQAHQSSQICSQNQIIRAWKPFLLWKGSRTDHMQWCCDLNYKKVIKNQQMFFDFWTRCCCFSFHLQKDIF